ncbi:hypothetical protein [Candidatus Odyssella thessalonicensis]|uniref:hypothetical protein n=1 Tax=Candidatus Odyssella thessalonicensis TaxID=84647 RepID=UPI0002E06386|nr:hypothetical protein [Candidatus Odyssella thessalonicensis]
MRKTMTPLILTATMVCVVQANVFKGYSVGLSAGILSSHNNISTKEYMPVSNYKSKAYKAFGSYGIQFGYHYSSANSWYWGVGVDLLLYPAKAEIMILNIQQ